MKKRLVAVILTIFLIFGFTSCSNVVNPDEVVASPNTDLVNYEIIDNNYYGFILVDKNTKVMYYWLAASTGGITPIYTADGTLKIYEEP